MNETYVLLAECAATASSMVALMDVLILSVVVDSLPPKYIMLNLPTISIGHTRQHNYDRCIDVVVCDLQHIFVVHTEGHSGKGKHVYSA